ncbi:MAG: hypothetical protein JOZ41_05615 [Chloroflexi bacterium]|nr:hypothetical protein [Chloroflexota bacterium]
MGAIAAVLLLSLLPGTLPANAQQASAPLEPPVTLPNQNITLAGTNFPTDTGVTVSLTVDLRGGGNRTVSTSSVTDSNGDFAVGLFVPYQAAPGRYSVVTRAGTVETSNQLRVLPPSAHPSTLGFRWVSLWYHTVRQGTWDYVILQSTLQTQLGIWVHVIFPNGRHWDFYLATDHSGRWSVRFTIPGGSISRHSNQAYIAFQLWYGSETSQSFMNFTLV